jgi:hypothetical protein
MNTVQLPSAPLAGRSGQPDGVTTWIPQQVNPMQHRGGLMAGHCVASDGSPGTGDAKRVPLARIASRGFDRGPGRVDAVTYSHQVAGSRQ